MKNKLSRLFLTGIFTATLVTSCIPKISDNADPDNAQTRIITQIPLLIKPANSCKNPRDNSAIEVKFGDSSTSFSPGGGSFKVYVNGKLYVKVVDCGKWLEVYKNK